MEGLIIILIVICCLLLAAVILIQNPKEGGLTAGLSSAHQIGGVKKTGDFLEKATWILAIGVVVLCMASAAFNDPSVPTKDGDQLEQTTGRGTN